MVDVPLRHRRQALPGRTATPRPFWRRPLVLFAGAVLAVLAAGAFVKVALQAYEGHLVLTGYTDDRTPAKLVIGSEQLAIPANMLRFAKARAGGPIERADLALYWPTLEGYTSALADAFKQGTPAAPIVYVTISLRDSPLDSTARLDEVYARFFVDKPLPGPNGLVGRRLGKDSGYEGEIVYFAPSEPRPFVARCSDDTSPVVPSTCLRDVNFGRGLSVLYRFNRTLLGDWRTLDAAVQGLTSGFLAP